MEAGALSGQLWGHKKYLKKYIKYMEHIKYLYGKRLGYKLVVMKL